jgi:hypothetical protein
MGRSMSPEARARMAAAKTGRAHSAEHNEAIRAGIVRANAEGRGPHASFWAELTEGEVEQYRELMRKIRRRNVVLQAIGRSDLIRGHRP